MLKIFTKLIVLPVMVILIALSFHSQYLIENTLSGSGSG